MILLRYYQVYLRTNLIFVHPTFGHKPVSVSRDEPNNLHGATALVAKVNGFNKLLLVELFTVRDSFCSNVLVNIGKRIVIGKGK